MNASKEEIVATLATLIEALMIAPDDRVQELVDQINKSPEWRVIIESYRKKL